MQSRQNLSGHQNDARLLYLLHARRIRNTTSSITRTIANIATGMIFPVKNPESNAPRIIPSVNVRSAAIMHMITLRQHILGQDVPPSKLSVIIFTPILHIRLSPHYIICTTCPLCDDLFKKTHVPNMLPLSKNTLMTDTPTTFHFIYVLRQFPRRF